MKKVIFATIFVTGIANAAPPDFIPPGHQYGEGNSSVDIKNRNRNTNQQGQAQGQIQGQSLRNDIRNANNNANFNSSSSRSDSRSSSSALSSSASGAHSSAYSGGSNSVASSGGNSINISGDIERNPVSSAYAPALTASAGTCMGSTSAGGQGSTFGISFGTTWTDKECNIRKNAMLLQGMGYVHAAKHYLCDQDEAMREAMGADLCGHRHAEEIPEGTYPEDGKRLKRVSGTSNAFFEDPTGLDYNGN